MGLERTYIAIDLKSFYASVECVDRGLDPLTTLLVVADKTRTEKTICLAVSPALKAYGIGGRARLFEAVQRVREVNRERRRCAGRPFAGKSANQRDLEHHPDWQVDFVVAPPQMAHYMEVSTRIYDIYLQYVAPEDIHVYSIDEVFMDVTAYLKTYRMTARQLAITIVRHVLRETGITATSGIGTNLYLCKVAMDIVAKHMPADEDGVRIGQLDEMSYRRQLWNHRPLTSFWRVGHGIAQKLAPYGIDTMGKIARLSLHNEQLLYRLFGVNAELLIDHAWGWEPCTLDYVKTYQPDSHSFSSGQVLTEPYDFKKARVVVQEMADAVALDLVEKRMQTDLLTLTVGYDVESLANPQIHSLYHGFVTTDHYGRQVPKHAHGTARLACFTSSSRLITDAILQLYDRIVHPNLLVRRINLSTHHVAHDVDINQKTEPRQLELFVDETAQEEERLKLSLLEKEQRMQEARLAIRKRFGKNAIIKGLNLQDGATAIQRNKMIGGHQA